MKEKQDSIQRAEGKNVLENRYVQRCNEQWKVWTTTVTERAQAGCSGWRGESDVICDRRVATSVKVYKTFSMSLRHQQKSGGRSRGGGGEDVKMFSGDDEGGEDEE